jgi:Uma2 family endonuclease
MISNLETINYSDAFTFPRFTLNFRTEKLTEKQFEALCRDTPDLKFELSARGELIIVPPTSPESGWKNSDVTTDVTIWSRKDKNGIVFDSSTLFTFPNGAKRSPDISWMSKEKWESVSKSERRKFSRVVPEFVIELLSPTDTLIETQEKMLEYIENGVKLAWLIDTDNKQVHIYRANGEVEVLVNPQIVSGENVLVGFELNVQEIF